MRKQLSRKIVLVCFVFIVVFMFTACGNKKNIDAELQGEWAFANNNFVHECVFSDGTFVIDHYLGSSSTPQTHRGTYEIDTRHNVIRCIEPGDEEGYVFDYTYNTDSGELRLSWNGNSYVKIR